MDQIHVFGCQTFKGKFSVCSARELIRTKYYPLEGVNLLWQQPIHPSLAAQNWKFLRGACATMDKVRSRFRYSLATKRYVCQNAEESLDHILWHCNFAVGAWSWISGIFNLTPNVNLTFSYKEAKGSSRIIKELWLIANLVIRSELWFTRNKKVYEKKAPNGLFFQQRVFNFMSIHVDLGVSCIIQLKICEYWISFVSVIGNSE